MNNYKQLDIWNKAILLVDEVYNCTKLFPEHEKFGLVSQMRRAAVSIPSNIAEGAGRNTKPQFIQFLSITGGSLFELETQIIISQRQEYITTEKYKLLLQLIEDIQKMNYKLQKSLQ